MRVQRRATHRRLSNTGGVMRNPHGLTVASSLLSLSLCLGARAAWAQDEGNPGNCSGLPTRGQLKQFLTDAPSHGGEAGGLFHGTRMWAAVVNRSGQVCAFATSEDDPTQVWPGSQAIAKAKAYTANAFSLDALALSTARLYTFVQPGHSLWGLNESNLFNADFLARPSGDGGGRNRIAGGIITFGGGVALYSGGHVVGGLGISGDTACTDHEIAKRVRGEAGRKPPRRVTPDATNDT